MVTTANQISSERQARPVAYVSLHDNAVRNEILSVLERRGWTVISQPTGFHVLQAISNVIEGEYTWRRPGLIVIDAYSRGCSGVTIAAGLRDLGIEIPVVVVAASGDALPVSSDETLRISEAAAAPSTVAELATPVASAATVRGPVLSPAARAMIGRSSPWKYPRRDGRKRIRWSQRAHRDLAALSWRLAGGARSS